MLDPELRGGAELTAKERILVVDDDDAVRALLGRILMREGYRCRMVRDAAGAMEWMQRAPYDLLVCDVLLPDGSGLDVLAWAMQEHDRMAGLMVSGLSEVTLAQRALELGAYGYMLKPFTANEVLIAVYGALRQRQSQHAQLEAHAAEGEAIRRLCVAAEHTNPQATRHIGGTSELSLLVARELRLAPRHCALIHAAAPMHDMGLVIVPPHIPLKKAPLTQLERAQMQKHAEAGYRMLAGSPHELLLVAATIAWTHHERLDGTGYPRGLSGTGIPIEGRIFGAVDVFDALLRDRPWRPRHTYTDAQEILQSGAGTLFDAEVVEALFAVSDRLASPNEGADALSLTPREREVLQMAADGSSAADIARNLTLSRATVKTHFQNIYAKLGTHDRASAVAEALRRGVIG